MIGAAWHPEGPDAAERLVRRIGDGVDARVVRCASAPGEPGVALLAARGARLEGERTVRGELAALDALSFTTAPHLRGNYAFASPASGGLLLGRGILGGHALYHRRVGNAVVASSSFGRLATLTPVAVDVDALAAFLACVPAPVDRTVGAGIRRLRCAEAVVVGNRFQSARREVPALSDNRMTVDEAAERLWALVRASVRRAIEPHRCVAVATGGGLDSSGLLAAALAEARGAAPREVLAVALHFAAPGDDRPYMTALCEALGIRPLRVPPSAGGPFFRASLVVDAAPYVGAPFDIALPLAAKAHGAEAWLSGNLGDEIFEGHLRSLSRELGPMRAAMRMMRLELPWATTRRQRVRSYVLAPHVQRFVPEPLLRDRHTRAVLRAVPWAGPRVRSWLREVPLPERSAPRGATARYEAMAHADRWCDAADARAQVEAVTGLPRIDPFQDEDLARFLATVPTAHHLHGHLHRGLLRHALRGKIPDVVRLRRDKAWFEPALAEVTLAAGGFDVVADLRAAPRLASLGLVDPLPFGRAFDRLRSAPDDTALGELWSYVWMTLAAEAFLGSPAFAGASS